MYTDLQLYVLLFIAMSVGFLMGAVFGAVRHEDVYGDDD